RERGAPLEPEQEGDLSGVVQAPAQPETPDSAAEQRLAVFENPVGVRVGPGVDAVGSIGPLGQEGDSSVVVDRRAGAGEKEVVGARAGVGDRGGGAAVA